MRALVSRAVGGPDTLDLVDLPDPTAPAGAVVIDVKACGINFPDSLIIEDRYQYKPARPFAPGGEVAGVVSAVGAGVDDIRVGQRVIATLMWGGLAEKAVASRDAVFPMPDAMPFDEGAAFLLTYATTIHALVDRAHIRAGDTLLVLGAAGGVGIAAIELGKACGARVVAAVSSQDKLDFALAQGADGGLVYPRGPFDKDGQKALADQFKAAVGPNGADIVYDAVGGDYAEAALRAIAWEGRHLVVGFPAGIPRIPLNLTLLKGCQIVGVFWGDFCRRTPERNRANVETLMRLYGEGKVKPVVSERFTLADGGQAIRRLTERAVKGKVVVTVP